METLLCKGFTFILRDRPTRIGGPGFFMMTPPRPRELRFRLIAGLDMDVEFFSRNRKYCIIVQYFEICSIRQKKITRARRNISKLLKLEGRKVFYNAENILQYFVNKLNFQLHFYLIYDALITSSCANEF
jgi:hypothetical protein